MNNQTEGRWSESECNALLDAIEKHGGYLTLLIAKASSCTGRSPDAIKRKLVKMGYLSKHQGVHQSMNKALGHVR
jgi:hypothetical protein